MELKDKKILVTGSSSGIGRAEAIECAKQGAFVGVHYLDNSKGAEETLKEIEKFSKGAVFQADLSKPPEVESMFDKFKEKGLDDLDLLVNNAGKFVGGDFDDLEVWEGQWKNIFMSQVYVTNEFIKSSTSKKLRKIVNTSSVYGIGDMANPNAPAYSAAKAAIISFTKALAKKYAPNLLVNAVAPGFTTTPAWEGTSAEELKACADLNKTQRFVTAEEIATMVLEILKNDSMTGEVIRVDGGLHLLNVR